MWPREGVAFSFVEGGTMARKSKRGRLTPEEWRAVLERQGQSGLGVTAFCRREGLVPTTFHKWKARLGRAEGEGRFLEVKRSEGGGSAWSMELELPHGVVLRIRG